MGRFDDRASQPGRGLRDLLRWRQERRAARRAGPPPPDVPAPRAEADLELLRSPRASLTWVGHASFALRLGGKLVLFDPVWSERLGGLVRRLAPPGLPLDALPPPDLVLVSHDHWDHLDLPTLRRFGKRPTYVVPLGNERFLRGLGARVIELDWWQKVQEGGLELTLVPARHWSSRMGWDRNDALWGGFLVRGPEGTAYHAGDTGFFEGFVAIGRQAGPIDWAMLPIGAYAPRWFMEPQHMDPVDAGQAFELLLAKRFVAMHWGTFKLTDEPTSEPPERLRAWWKEQRLAEERLWIPAIGESRPLD